jgi:ribosomal protein S18 acetylase RimI-like enzyme
VKRLRDEGRTRIIYAGYGWWRQPFSDEIAQGYGAAGFGRFEGVFLLRPIVRDEGGFPSAPPGFAHEEWHDDRFDEVCELMLRTPEPEALYWDMGLCRRSIRNAGHPVPPLFRDGFGQLIVRERDRKVVAFALATTGGYVNHVYADQTLGVRGLGTAVLGRLIASLSRAGIAHASILTHDTNPRAISVYERLGFKAEFRFPQFWLKW